MVAEAEATAGLAITLSALFDGEATIRRLARVAAPVARTARVAPTQQLVPVATTGTGSPLFVVCADESSLLALRWLPEGLGANRPLYGLLPRRQGRAFDPESSVEELASELLPVVRATAPAGPYLLAGHSFGGLIAYHLAVLLASTGEGVGYLGLLDTVSAASARHYGWRLDVRRAFRRLRRRLGRDRPRGVLSGADLGPTAWEVDVAGAGRLARRYREPAYEGRVDLYLTESVSATSPRRNLGWDVVDIGELVSTSVPGGHLSMLQPPHVRVVTELVRARLDEVDPA
jgi:thioesterase domain-containing protein